MRPILIAIIVVLAVLLVAYVALASRTPAAPDPPAPGPADALLPSFIKTARDLAGSFYALNVDRQLFKEIIESGGLTPSSGAFMFSGMDETAAFVANSVVPLADEATYVGQLSGFPETYAAFRRAAGDLKSAAAALSDALQKLTPTSDVTMFLLDTKNIASALGAIGAALPALQGYAAFMTLAGAAPGGLLFAQKEADAYRRMSLLTNYFKLRFDDINAALFPPLKSAVTALVNRKLFS